MTIEKHNKNIHFLARGGTTKGSLRQLRSDLLKTHSERLQWRGLLYAVHTWGGMVAGITLGHNLRKRISAVVFVW